MQEAFYRASEAEPTQEDLSALLQSSVPEEWLYDDDSNNFTFKKNLLVRVVPDHDEAFVLYYGHQPAFDVSKRNAYEHLPLKRSKIMQLGR